MYSPTVKLDSLRTIFAIAVENNLDIYGMDVIGAYLHADMDTEVYIKQIIGFQDDSGDVLLLLIQPMHIHQNI